MIGYLGCPVNEAKCTSNSSMKEVRETAQDFCVRSETVLMCLLAFSHIVVCTKFKIKDGCSLSEQEHTVLVDTISNTLIGCASLCDRHRSCVTFEYSKEVSGKRQCRLSGTSCTADISQTKGKPVYELVSTIYDSSS